MKCLLNWDIFKANCFHMLMVADLIERWIESCGNKIKGPVIMKLASSWNSSWLSGELGNVEPPKDHMRLLHLFGRHLQHIFHLQSGGHQRRQVFQGAFSYLTICLLEKWRHQKVCFNFSRGYLKAWKCTYLNWYLTLVLVLPWKRIVSFHLIFQFNNVAYMVDIFDVAIFLLQRI